ncbi:phosrestin-2-like isoform X2 [Artemia franciscana]|uniref:phosrestin-2-like isoform X2 n=1 Tax=Artemia franciscana TaxID=6661 RepID=UPI0032DB3C6F
MEKLKKKRFQQVVQTVANIMSVTKTFKSYPHFMEGRLQKDNVLEASTSDMYDALPHLNGKRVAEDGNEISNENDEDARCNGAEYSQCRVYKKVSLSRALALYLPKRDFAITENDLLRIDGVFTINEEEMKTKKVFIQVTITFRYGRDDEEVMGLRLSNESILYRRQIFPRETEEGPVISKNLNSAQHLLLQKLGSSGQAFCIQIVKKLPPSVRLVPASDYKGAAIGINYDIRMFAEDFRDENLLRQNMVKMNIRVTQEVPRFIFEKSQPTETICKNLQILTEGKLFVTASLDKWTYKPKEKIVLSLDIDNTSEKSIKKIKACLIQKVDVSAFSNGKIKNNLATVNMSDSRSSIKNDHYILELELISNDNKKWIALEPFYEEGGDQLAGSTFQEEGEERNYWTIYVEYYVKVTIGMSWVTPREMSMKLPFTLLREDKKENNFQLYPEKVPELREPIN